MKVVGIADRPQEAARSASAFLVIPVVTGADGALELASRHLLLEKLIHLGVGPSRELGDEEPNRERREDTEAGKHVSRRGPDGGQLVREDDVPETADDGVGARGQGGGLGAELHGGRLTQIGPPRHRSHGRSDVVESDKEDENESALLVDHTAIGRVDNADPDCTRR